MSGLKKVVHDNFHYNFFPALRKKCNYMLFTVKGNVMIAEWSACALNACVVVHSCQRFEKHCYSGYICV
jgi:hypothetical protein